MAVGAVMTQMFTSGYSDELLHFTVNEDTHSISYVDSWKVESNFSFGHASDKFSSLYFIHEVSEYEGTPNSGAVSRWQIDDVDFVAKNKTVALMSPISFLIVVTGSRLCYTL